MVRIRLERSKFVVLAATIPQSKIKDFCQPPLHKGALVRCGSGIVRRA